MNQDMNTETLEALEASIAKWERNAVAQNPEEYETGASSCPLCDLFIENKCRGCPVNEFTGHMMCAETPYFAAEDAWEYWVDRDTDEARAAAHAAARDEVEFLRSLLPGDHP